MGLDLNLDPAKMYAELKIQSNIVGRVFAGVFIPSWANNPPRVIIEIPQGADVVAGDRYYNNTFDRPDTFQVLVGNVWTTNTAAQTEKTRIDALNDNIGSATIGTVTPMTLSDLKAMTLAQFSTWFDANFDTTARIIGLLKRLTLIIIRRVG